MSNSDEYRDTLAYLCWFMAIDGSDFYPPEETAERCMEAVSENYEGKSESKRQFARGWEVGSHERVWTTAVEFFSDVRRRGIDPVALATEYHESIEPSDDEPLDPLDWSWLRDGNQYENVCNMMERYEDGDN